MPTMYTRSLKLPNHSFFLFGPRGTGKTTWLREKCPEALWFNLLLNRELFPLLQEPSLFRSTVEGQKPGSWIVVDEVQKHPDLLNEIHDLISVDENRYKFALSGSSARKLKRLDVNLLAGRVIERKMFPLTATELQFHFEEENLLSYGTLPAVQNKPDQAIDILEAYVNTYLKEEIQQEALVKNIGSFTRFLKVAAVMNSEILNVAGVARDAGVSRTTTQRYFQTLVDTLVATWLPAWQPRTKVRESAKPKFYFFDPGVVRTLNNRIRTPLSDLEKGALLETLILHELRSALVYQNIGGELSYWRSAGGREIDFIWSQGDTHIGFEVKSGHSWRKKYGKAIQEKLEKKILHRGYGIYLGERRLKIGDLEILPLKEFTRDLSSGKLLTHQE